MAPPKAHRPEAVPRVVEAMPREAAPAIRISPRAKKLAGEWLVDVAAIAGTGPSGRIVVRDVQAYLDEHEVGPHLVSPAALALARNTDVTIDELLRIAAGERITVETVERALRTRPQPLTGIRRVIAERMTQSAREIPHFDVTVSVDMAAVAAYRDAHPGPDGKKISFNDFIVAACASALREMPIVNARCIAAAGGAHAVPHGAHTVPHGAFAVQMNEEINIGVAVSIDEGLVVPVIRNAGARSIEKIAAESRRLVERARSKALGPDEMAGGTFTITNMGMLGVEQFRAIIHPEQGAILAVGAVEKVPMVRDGGLRVGTQMKMTLSCDHRIIDGAVGAQFLGLVKQRLEAYGG